MNDHYFSEQPNAASRPKTWETELKDYTFKLTSDEGVFSKRGIDLGTKLLVQAFEMPDLPGPLLDLGCGYGPIGLALAKANPSRKVIMVDINERAVNLASENAVQNGIRNVQICQSDLFEQVPAVDFSVILSNPPIRAGKKVVYHLFEGAYDHLAKGGEFWTVIRKQQGASSAVKKLREIYYEVSVIQKKKGFFIIKCTK
ncbi:MAG TPA: class I SAM-dependent methyltransferase [Bacillales bacterium]|nr:class I SAM-dependent methyltransferase [Bacillales bacterium]